MYAQGTLCKMIAHCTQQGKSIDEAMTFGERELGDDMRTCPNAPANTPRGVADPTMSALGRVNAGQRTLQRTAVQGRSVPKAAISRTATVAFNTASARCTC
jgi:hypothetical protein